MSRYLHHVTLTTGHVRRSWRHEIEPSIFPRLRSMIAEAREGIGALIPGIEPPTYLRITDTAKCALCSVVTDAVPVLTFAVADHARCGSQLWRMLIETARTPIAVRMQDRPETPWCAVRVEAYAAAFPPPHPMLPTLADMERCIAWAWLADKIKE